MQCSLSIFHTSPAFTTITITSNFWILISTPAIQGSAITMICPEMVTSSTLFQQPFHILKLPPASSAMSRHFHLPPHYKDHPVTMYISLDRANQCNQHFNSRFLHMATFQQQLDYNTHAELDRCATSSC